MVTGMNYIGGEWSGEAGRTFEDRNPANTGELIGTFPRSGSRQAGLAVEAARTAFPAWRERSRIERAGFLDEFAQLVKRDKEELARIVSRESGKCIGEARADIVEGIHSAQYWFGRSRMPSGEVLASEIAEKDSYVYHKPKGVVTAITPWNFPFAIPLWLVCPSLVEGNTVTLKPAEETPLIAQRLVEYFEKAGLPPGVLNLVQGDEEAGWPLVTHPDVDVVLFTGSAAVGAKIKQACAADYRKFCVCEMGGKNAMIVFDDADFDLTVNAAIMSAFRTTGQRCVSMERLLVQKGVFDSFVEAFVEKARRIRIGDPLDENTFMGPLVSQSGREKVEHYRKLAVEEGARVLLDGGMMTEGDYSRGFFVRPFVYTMAHDPKARVLREEVFGPHVAIMPFRDLEEAVRIYNDSEYAFALSVCARDYRTIRAIRNRCDFGVGYVNLPTIGAEVHLPFGGLKKSGTGMPSASGLIDAVTHRVSWTVNHGAEFRLAQGLSAEVPE